MAGILVDLRNRAMCPYSNAYSNAPSSTYWATHRYPSKCRHNPDALAGLRPLRPPHGTGDLRTPSRDRSYTAQ